MILGTKETWNAQLYDEKLSFVSELGKGVVDLLDPQEGEFILDLGCGTGDLTNEIAVKGAKMTGMDRSETMIQAARSKYAQLDFIIADAEKPFNIDQPFDAVFSNAALHWMKRPELVIDNVWNVLKPGGRFVAEFGGKDNVNTIVNAITNVLKSRYNIDANERNPWYYPSIGQYSQLLEKRGFRVTYAIHFDRPTRMEGDDALIDWLTAFSDSFFHSFSEEEQIALYEQVANLAKPDLYADGGWMIDYKRIRIKAFKP